MSHRLARDAYLSEKADRKAEQDAEQDADEKYEKERLNDPVDYFEWFTTTEEYKNSTTQTYPGSSGENGTASVPR